MARPSKLSEAEVADRLGAKSRNAYARYEQGASVPTIEKLDQLLRAVSPGPDCVLALSRAKRPGSREAYRQGRDAAERINSEWESIDAEV